MNQEPENKITDQQLDDMLRDIQVPADLKARLLEIPHTKQAQDQQDQLLVTPKTSVPVDRQTGTRWLQYTLVATLLITAGIAATQPFRKNTTSPPDTVVQQNKNTDQQTGHNLLAANKHLQNSGSIDIETQLSQASARSFLSTEDVSSMIIALAPEYSVELGGIKADIESEMVLVQKKFPQSRGADLAQQILQRLN